MGLMKKLSIGYQATLLAVCVAYILSSGQIVRAAKPKSKALRWSSNLAAAQKEAKRLNVPIIVHFYADWCGPCRRMDRETLHSKSLSKQTRGKFLAVKINTDRQPGITRKYSVRALPTDLFIGPTGRVISRVEGYQTTRQYLARAARVDASFAANRKVALAKNKQPVQQPKPVVVIARKPAKKVTVKKVAVGMDGYSPVALWNHRKWVEGRAEFAMKHKGVTYHFANAKERKEFELNPALYAPRLLGCDPVILQGTDRAIAGDIEYGAYFDGELFFFVSKASRKKFRETPLRYTRTRHVLRVNKFKGTARQ